MREKMSVRGCVPKVTSPILHAILQIDRIKHPPRPQARISPYLPPSSDFDPGILKDLEAVVKLFW